MIEASGGVHGGGHDENLATLVLGHEAAKKLGERHHLTLGKQAL